MKVVPQNRSPAVLCIVTLLHMGYVCSNMEISTQCEILSQFFFLIAKIDTQEPLTLRNYLLQILYTCFVVCFVIKEMSVVEVINDETCIHNLPKRISPF